MGFTVGTTTGGGGEIKVDPMKVRGQTLPKLAALAKCVEGVRSELAEVDLSRSSGQGAEGLTQTARQLGVLAKSTSGLIERTSSMASRALARYEGADAAVAAAMR